MVVKVKDLSKSFDSKSGRVCALKGLSFEVQAGAVFALLGPNGSGKTTTLNILSQLLDPDSGDFQILGRGPADPRYFESVSFMAGDSEFYWAFSVEVTLKFYAELHRASWSTVLELLRDLSAEYLLPRKWMVLSNGEKTKIRLVQCLLSRPKVLFLDEPTVGLDPDIAETVRSKLKSLNTAGLTLVLTSHYMKDIDSLATHIAFIRKGEIVESGERRQYGSLDELEGRFIQLAREGR